jgi:hypothetical protein
MKVKIFKYSTSQEVILEQAVNAFLASIEGYDIQRKKELLDGSNLIIIIWYS